jgi:UDP-glucose 4-epimerase
MTGPVVVTGAAGFVGRSLLKILAGEGVPAVAVTRRATPGAVRVADYADTPAPKGAVLVHLAQPRDASASADPDQLRTCSALADKPWSHVVYASSAAVYGDGETHAHRPDEAVQPVSAYARAKLECERAFEQAGATTVRLANLYGPGMAPNNVLADILRQIPGTGPLKLRDLAPVRDFLWIDDAARCLAAACGARPGGVLNAGTGRGVSVAELARLALQAAGESSRAVVAERDGGRASTLILDISSTRAALGWAPRVALEQGLATLITAAA